MKHNPDDRRDNVERIQRNINHTIKNTELAEEIIAKSEDEKTRKALIEKNERRRNALKGMKEEIRDEAIDRKHDYK